MRWRLCGGRAHRLSRQRPGSRATRPPLSLEGSRGRGTLGQEKPPIGGMIEGGGDVAMRLLAKVTQEIVKPLIKTTRAPGWVLTRKSRSFLTLLKDCLKWKVRAHSRNSSTHDRLGFAATD
jgi:hypothetical protein